jgi:hypothetical protein
LVIAKIDRLSCDAHFLLGLQKAGVRFVAADMPEANEMVVEIILRSAWATTALLAGSTGQGVLHGWLTWPMRGVFTGAATP